MTPRSAAIASVLALSWAIPTQAADVTVLDGDSLLYDGKQVEIWGIIAPQKSETCKTAAGKSWPCGQLVFDQLSAVASDATFSCAEKEPGFVTCHSGGLDVGLLLVKEGLARARQSYSDVEARAREAGVGLWE